MLHLMVQTKRHKELSGWRGDLRVPSSRKSSDLIMPSGGRSWAGKYINSSSTEIVSYTGIKLTFKYNPNTVKMEISAFVPRIKPSVNVQSSEILQAIQSQDFWSAVNDSNLFPDLSSKMPSKLQICCIQEVRSISMRRTGWSTNSIAFDLSNKKFFRKYFSLLYKMIFECYLQTISVKHS